MIESVAARQQGAYNFEDHYDNLCALQDCAPLPAVKSHLAQGVVDLNGDRVRLNDWQPIINSIRINKSLQFIAVRSYYQMPQEEDEKRAAILRRKLPSIRSKEITHRLVKALKECLFVSPCLSCVELQGLSLRERDLQMLVKGILRSATLRHLSLEFCRIGDQGLEVLCKGLKNSKHINSVNLSGCSLSYRGAECLAAVIKHQGMQRHNEAWRDSLRYRRPDLDRMSGLRRITANGNPMLGDDGAAAFAEALKDDLWLKALDLQACGIGAVGASSFLEVLKYNTTLVVLDLRRNPLIERDIMHSVMEQLMLNSNGEDGEQYKWMSEKPQDRQGPAKPQTTVSRIRRRATKVLNSSLGKKTTIKVTPTSCRRRARPLAGRRVEIGPSPGLPWRTAARANRFRAHPPEAARYRADRSSDLSTSILFTSAAHSHLTTGEEEEDERPDDSSEILVKVDALAGSGGAGGLVVSRADERLGGGGGGGGLRTHEEEAMMKKLEESHMCLDLTNQKEVRIELEQMRRHLREERLARAKSDQKVVQLMIENRRLTEEVGQLQKAQNGARLAEDESFLESVEASFKQFHAFIDMLREAGMGQLVTMAGLDQSVMPFASNGNSDYTTNTTNGNDNHGKGGYTTHHHRNNNNNNISSSSNGYHGAASSSNGNNNNNNIHDPTYANVPEASCLYESVGGDDGDEFVRGAPYANFPRSRTYGDESDAARQEADDVYTRLVEDTRSSLNRQQQQQQQHDNGGGVPEKSTGGGGGAGRRDVSDERSHSSQEGARSRHREEKEEEEAGRSPLSPDKSGAETEEGEEPSSSQGVSGRGQDDRRAGPIHDMSAQDLDSGDEDF